MNPQNMGISAMSKTRRQRPCGPKFDSDAYEWFEVDMVVGAGRDEGVAEVR